MNEAIQLRPTQLMDFLSKSIPAHHPVLVIGGPGTGKSDIVAQACETAGANLIIKHPVVEDPTDPKGMPWVKDGKATFIPFHDMQALMDADKLTVCFLDDLGQAPPVVQAAYMQLLLARRINGHVISDHVCFVAATNRHSDRAGVRGILEPVKSRFTTIVELQPNIEDWVTWALNAGLPTELIAFIRFRPGLLYDFKPTNELTNSPCPRTVNNVGKLMQLGLPPELEYPSFAGAAGEGFATEFVGFLRIFRQLPNPDFVIMNPDKADVPEDPATLYAICGALSNKASEQTMERIVTYTNRLPAEFQVLLINDCAKKDPAVCSTRAFIEWQSANSNVMI